MSNARIRRKKWKRFLAHTNWPCDELTTAVVHETAPITLESMQAAIALIGHHPKIHVQSTPLRYAPIKNWPNVASINTGAV